MVKKTSEDLKTISMQSNGYAQHTKKKMLESTVISWLLKFLVPPLWVLVFIQNLDNIKSTILFVLTVVAGMWRLWRGHITSKQNKILKDLQIREKQIEVLEREIEAEKAKKKMKWH